MIPVQNIYYMLSYAFQALQAQNYKDLATVKFHNTAELCAAILDKGISVQLKRGLGRDYLPKSESLSTLQGKLNISESIKTQTLLKKQMICTYDEFSTNTQFNQIIKSTLLLLLKANITNTRKKSLRNLLLFFSDVSEIDLRFVNWSQHYNRSNQSYQMLIAGKILSLQFFLSLCHHRVNVRTYFDLSLSPVLHSHILESLFWIPPMFRIFPAVSYYFSFPFQPITARCVQSKTFIWSSDSLIHSS